MMENEALESITRDMARITASQAALNRQYIELKDKLAKLMNSLSSSDEPDFDAVERVLDLIKASSGISKTQLLSKLQRHVDAEGLTSALAYLLSLEVIEEEERKPPVGGGRPAKWYRAR
jgi:hypothetical protein